MARHKSIPQWSQERLNELYNIDKLSTYEMAEILETTPPKVRNALLYYGIKLRDKSESTKLKYEQGKREAPNKGEPRPEKVKRKIGKVLSDKYNSLDEEGKKAWAARSKAYFDSLSPEDKERFVKMGRYYVSESAKYGSKLERFISQELYVRGYAVEVQKKNLISNENLRVDIYLRDMYLAIELDGAAHTIDIYNDESEFRKRRIRDETKNALLNQYGFKVLRVRYFRKMSKTRMLGVLQKILDVLENIKNGTLRDKVIYLEIDKED